MTHVSTCGFALLSGLLLLSACGSRDPYLRNDVWQPTGANAGNLAAMVANPHDLLVGRHATTSDTKASTVAIQHIWDGQPQPLSYSSGSGGASAATSGGGQAGGNGGASNAPSASPGG